MISPSEISFAEQETRKRTVTPLEFEDLRDFSSQEAGNILDSIAPDMNERRENDALVEMEARLRSLAELHEREMEEARSQTRAEVYQELAVESERRIAQEREAIVRCCEQFLLERARYFASVEAEIIRLSLAIAAHVLHRETQMDPLLLRGAVKVALDKVQGGEAVMLRICEQQTEDWKRILAEAHREDVTVMGDSRLQAGECVLETSVGRVDLDVKAQLEEIEKGFFDLLQQRPT